MPEIPFEKPYDVVEFEVVLREKLRDGSVLESAWNLVPGTFTIEESRQVQPVRRNLATGEILELGVVPCSHVLTIHGAVRGDGWEDGR